MVLRLRRGVFEDMAMAMMVRPGISGDLRGRPTLDAVADYGPFWPR
jgi:hypothetical protein